VKEHASQVDAACLQEPGDDAAVVLVGNVEMNFFALDENADQSSDVFDRFVVLAGE
jgi:hypothetical protein